MIDRNFLKENLENIFKRLTKNDIFVTAHFNEDIYYSNHHFETTSLPVKVSYSNETFRKREGCFEGIEADTSLKFYYYDYNSYREISWGELLMLSTSNFSTNDLDRIYNLAALVFDEIYDFLSDYNIPFKKVTFYLEKNVKDDLILNLNVANSIY